MNLFKKLKRFEVKKLFVCRIYSADNLRYKPYLDMISEYYSIWTPRFLGIKILYGDKVLKDPIYDIEYISIKEINGLNPSKNQYYQIIGNIIDIMGEDSVNKKLKISLDKIKELNSKLDEILSKNSNKD